MDFWEEAGIKRGSLLWPVAEKLEDMGKHAAAALMREIGLRKPEPYLTGSQAYGKPTPESDTDICVFVTGIELAFIGAAYPFRPGYGHHPFPCMQFPGYDILMFTERVDFDCWKDVTDRLAQDAPVSREAAVAAFETMVQTRNQIKSGGMLLGRKGSIKMGGAYVSSSPIYDDWALLNTSSSGTMSSSYTYTYTNTATTATTLSALPAATGGIFDLLADDK
jgi:hypothetical protein